MTASPTPVRAIVAHDPIDGKPTWTMEDVTLPPVGDYELLVKIIATGVCASDISVASAAVSPADFPRVLGHEGAGYVVEIGPCVTAAKVGDAVLLSFDSCSACKLCTSSHPAYCREWSARNMHGAADSFFASDKTPYRGKFFGQSSFASMTLASEGSVVNVTGLVTGDDELKLLAPLGCGFQTGSGAITNIAKASLGDTVVVFGLGGVGFAAVMAAKRQGCAIIIGVDIVESKLEMAKSLGATHGINSSDPAVNVVDAIKKLTEGYGASIAIETSGNLNVMKAAVEGTMARGQVVLIGLPKYTDLLSLHVISTIASGRQIRGCIEGDAIPTNYLPQLIQWMHEGTYPIDQIVKYYPAEDYQQAIYDIKHGLAIKPILVW